MELEKVAGSYLIKCRGIDEDLGKPLTPSEAETVIVKLYSDGKSIPLCRFLEDVDNNKCSADTKHDMKEPNHAFCPYRSFS